MHLASFTSQKDASINYLIYVYVASLKVASEDSESAAEDLVWVTEF